MIQRIQTLYLLLVVALGIALVWLPVVEFVSTAVINDQTDNQAVETIRTWQLKASGVRVIHWIQDTGVYNEPAPVQGIWGLLLATLIIPVFALVDIFLYKKRILQARLNIFTVMFCLGWYGVLFIYIWQAKLAQGVEWYIMPWASIPLVCMILTLMATRRILKDEALVRAADRIR